MSLWFKDLPKGWEEAPLKSRLARNDGGVWGEDPAGDDTDTVVLRSTEQRVDGAWNIEAPALRKLTKAEAESGRLHVGDLVVTKSSGSELHIGKTSLVTPEVAALNACYSNFMQRLRVDERTDPRFVHYWMNNELCREQFAYLSNSTSGLANLNGTVLGTARLAFPPHEQQTHIANFLDEQTARIDALIAEKERLQAAIEESWTARLCHTMQTAACLGEADVAPGWNVLQLKRLCDSIQTGRTPSGARDDCFDEGGTPWATPGDLRGLFVKDSVRKVSDIALKEDEVRLYPAGATLLVGIGSIGNVSHALVSVSANQQVNILVPNASVVDPIFLTLCVAANKEQVQIAAGAATLPIINQEKTGRIRVAIPALQEQRRIRADLLSLREHLDALSAHVDAHIAHLREYRSSLISAAVTGQLDLSTFKAAA